MTQIVKIVTNEPYFNELMISDLRDVLKYIPILDCMTDTFLRFL